MRKEKSRQTVAKSMLRAVILGGLFGGAALIIMILLSAVLILNMKSLSQTAVFAAAIISSCVSAFLAGFISARILKEKGMAVGTLSAFLLFVLILATGTVLFADSVNLDTLLRFAAMLLSGAFGGVLGVNNR